MLTLLGASLKFNTNVVNTIINKNKAKLNKIPTLLIIGNPEVPNVSLSRLYILVTRSSESIINY